MARVSRITASSTRSRQREHFRQASELYPSINTIMSGQLQAEEEHVMTCGEWLKKGCKTLFDFTIASCECFSCLVSKSYRRLASDGGDEVEEDHETIVMKEKLNFHFMNPFQKWRYAKQRRFPWKLLVQLLSIFLVTTQLILFASTKSALTSFILENQGTFTKLFVNVPDDPDPDDPLPNPVVTLYTRKDLESQINYTIDRFFILKNISLGTYSYGWGSKLPSIRIVTEKRDEANVNPHKKVFNVTKDTHEVQTDIFQPGILNVTNITSDIYRTLRISLFFNISSVLVRPSSGNSMTAECVQFRLEFRYVNDRSSGSVPVQLNSNADITQCNNDTSAFKTESTVLSSPITTGVDVVVMIFALISIAQCMRSLLGSWRLSREVKAFFWKKFDYRLKYHQVTPLFNSWFVGVIITNILILVGSILKLLVAYDVITNLSLVDLTSIFIGLAVFGQWCGLLRFLSYFDKYNMLLITLRLSLPSVIRFIVCTGILYIAFLLCGWLVLGPYHPKFRDPIVTSDCLFSLINGDDMFATYKGMADTSQAAYIFSKIYLYVFIALFIYVVLSVFISLISDTYETLHEHWYERSKGLLVDFATGKLGQPHYHSDLGAAHSDIFHEDRTAEEDYEYLREASHRFGPGLDEDRPLIINGGPELRPSSASSAESNASNNRRGAESPYQGGGGTHYHQQQHQQQHQHQQQQQQQRLQQQQLPHIQVHNYQQVPRPRRSNSTNNM